ncbi:MAG: sulfotransferase [Deltaproteobacteria bacterium]
MGSERQKPLRVEQFTTARNAQPWWYRATNRVGRVLPSFGTPSAEAWFEKAKRKNLGVGDPRPETLAALEALLHSVREDAQLSFSGRIAAQMDCLRMAGQHLLIEQAIRETPEILDAQIPPPIFLIGWMRTGTTFVHRLLAQDPDTRTMPYWESMYPVPPKTGKDGRAEELAHVLKQLEAISPNYEAIHPMGAHEPEECVALFTNVFRTLQYNVQYRVPSYVEWLQGQDARVAYGQYRQQLQLVQFHRPHGIRFALKDPTHSVFLDTILELFPDARFVFTHRDPAATMSSLCSLYAYTRALFSDDVDPRALGPELMNSYLPGSLERAVKIVDGLASGRVAHLRHVDVRSDPIGAMARAYRDLGMELSEQARTAMHAMLDAESRKPRDIHIHSPEGFGLSAEGVRDRLSGYCQRFDL